MVACLLLRWRVLRSLVRARGDVSWSSEANSETWPIQALATRSVRSWRSRKPQGNSPPVLFQMATGYWLSQAVYVAAKLGLADLLKDGPRSCQELAAVTGTDPQCLFRLMRALSAARIFVHTQGDHFALATEGKSLQSEAPGSQRAIIMTLGEVHYQAWGNLLYSV
jgi:hypothetical protein